MKNKLQATLLLGSLALNLAIQIKRYQEEQKQKLTFIDPSVSEANDLQAELQLIKEELAKSQEQIEMLKNQYRNIPAQTPTPQQWPDSWTCNTNKTISEQGTMIDSVPLTKDEILSQISTVAHSSEEALKKGITIATNSISEILKSLKDSQGE